MPSCQASSQQNDGSARSVVSNDAASHDAALFVCSAEQQSASNCGGRVQDGRNQADRRDHDPRRRRQPTGTQSHCASPLGRPPGQLADEHAGPADGGARWAAGLRHARRGGAGLPAERGVSGAVRRLAEGEPARPQFWRDREGMPERRGLRGGGAGAGGCEARGVRAAAAAQRPLAGDDGGHLLADRVLP